MNTTNMGAFINPFTDWGFKHIFGREASKDVLIEFLNDLLQGERVITDVRYLNNEREPEQMEQRKVIYDIFCETDTGEHIIVEMQNRWQEHFKDRALFYMARSIVQQARSGRKWDFNLTAVYGVFFINFPLDKENNGYFCKDVALMEKRNGNVFNNKFRQFFIELPRFKKEEKECENYFECWIYNLINMDKLERISFKDQKAIFGRLEQIASQANLTKEEREQYETEWKIYNDYFNTIESAERKAAKEGREEGYKVGHKEGRAEGREEGRAEGREEGREEGRAEGREMGIKEERLEHARRMKARHYPIEDICEITGLKPEVIEKL